MKLARFVNRLLAAVIPLLLLPAVCFGGDTQNLPDFGDSAGSVVSPEYERRLGQAIMRQARRYANLVRDPEVDSYINSVGYQLVANSDDNQIPFNFFVIDDARVNAFAAPGGVIGINSGVILNSRDESELAGVLAHEIAHVTQRHMARTFEKADQFSIPSAAALIGAIALGIANPQAGVAAVALASGLSAQAQINFTRANEEEADRVGMKLLARSGFDPRGMPEFFQRLQHASKYYQGNAPEYLRTHPLTTSRIADSIARAEQYPKKEYTSSINFKLVRAKLLVHNAEEPGDAIKIFEQRLGDERLTDKDPERYGYALALTAADEFNRAQEQLRYLLEKEPENSAYLLAAADLESARRNFNAAIAFYDKAYTLYPDYRPVIYKYARALLDAKQPARAREILRKYGRDHEPDLYYFDLLSQAEAQTGHPAEAGIAKAEYYYLSGETQLAIDRLKYAQRQTPLDYYQEERVSARLAQLEYELQLEKELDIR
ncbi:MAG TPA: M48 family metalloprotease [Gammaproteobacteria bacterium]|nr:M48 family metalloprotease [Gammaproteobacteria bacterium]